MGAWRKVGKLPTIPYQEPTWYTCDVETLPKPHNYRWWVWKTNDQDKEVDESSRLLTGAELGMVMPPHLITERAHTGTWSQVYPRPSSK